MPQERQPGWFTVTQSLQPFTSSALKTGTGMGNVAFFLIFLSFYRPLNEGDPATALWGAEFLFFSTSWGLQTHFVPQDYFRNRCLPLSHVVLRKLNHCLVTQLPVNQQLNSKAAQISAQTLCNSLLTTPHAERAIWKFSHCHWPDLPPCTVRGLLSAWKLIIQHIIRAFNMKKYLASSYSS